MFDIEQEEEKPKCEACNGTGWVEEEIDDDGNVVTTECIMCGGTGIQSD